jgi:hypothetical protein
MQYYENFVVFAVNIVYHHVLKKSYFCSIKNKKDEKTFDLFDIIALRPLHLFNCIPATPVLCRGSQPRGLCPGLRPDCAGPAAMEREWTSAGTGHAALSGTAQEVPG